MSVQVNRTIGFMVSSIVGLLVYTGFVIQQYQAGASALDTIPSSWGTAVLVTMGVVVILSIVTAILMTVIEFIRTREEEFLDTDERDKLFELKADRISYSVSGVGILIAMILLAIGQPPLMMFNTIVYSLIGAGIVGYIIRLYYYRRGY